MDEPQRIPDRQRITFSMRDLLYFIVVPAYVMGVLRLVIDVRVGPALKIVFTLGPTVLLFAVLAARRLLRPTPDPAAPMADSM